MMTLSARTIAALFLAGWMLSTAPPAAPSVAAQHAPIFKFEADEFWLNLHHFLYVLGRAEAKESDASGDAVAGAPADAEKGMASLGDDERRIWRAAVTAYAGGLSKKDAVFDATWPALTAALARAGDAATLATHQSDTAGTIDAATRATLESAAPIYRRVWWPAHRTSNQAWRTAAQPLVDRHGPAIVDFLTKAYGQSWPADGYPAHLSMYANWSGAYSTDGRLLVVGTNPNAGTTGLDGLEIVFHEGMHQWDGMFETIGELARVNNVPEQRGLSHALIFFTAGEAVKRVVPAHVPYAEKYGLWNGRMKPLKAPLDEAWKAYLDGPALGDKTARDAAIVAVLKKAPPPPPRSPAPPPSPKPPAPPNPPASPPPR
jgi:hypothetical protein